MKREAAKECSTQEAVRIAEAAAWVAHLHGTQRSPDSDRGLQLWLKDHPQRPRVWEAATEVWEEVGSLQGAAIAQALRSRRARRAPLVFAAAALAAVCLLVLRPEAGIATAVGEQRILTLEDGSRVTLNTATRVVVKFSERERRVELKSGEALFEVARQAARPFVVAAGERKIRALGTSFLVRRDSQYLAVTLMEGKVAVTLADAAEDGTTLAPGERLTLTGRSPAVLDKPALDKVTAWRQGKVVFDGLRLREAIAEMNRYGTAKLAIGNPRAQDLRISGVFRAGDSLSFARAVAATYRLHVLADRRRISLDGEPSAAYR